jgi:hypothetical protein
MRTGEMSEKRTGETSTAEKAKEQRNEHNNAKR